MTSPDPNSVAGHVATALANAHNAEDAAALGQLFTEDAEFVNIVGGRQSGRAAVEAGHAAAFKHALAGTDLTIEGVDAKPIANGVLLAHVPWRRDVTGEPGPRTLPPGSGLFTMVLTEEPTGWRLAALSNVEHAKVPG